MQSHRKGCFNQANCTGYTQDIPGNVGTAIGSTTTERFIFCSICKASLCAYIASQSPFLYANFTGDFPLNCASADSPESCNGHFSSTFGVYINEPANNNAAQV
jgi:hypothetical protein